MITSTIESSASGRNVQRARAGVLFVCLALAALTVLPFFYLGEDRAVGCCGGAMPITHDAWMHYNQMTAFQRGLQSGVLYPRWDDQTKDGYGAPTTSFYPPGVYYLTAFGYALFGNWRRALMLAYLLLMAGSGAAAYAYVRRALGRGAALIAMAAYMIAPYHLLNQYQRGAIAEYSSFVWAPLVLLFADRLLTELKTSRADSLRNFAGLAVSFGAFLWSHPPTAYQLLLIFGPFVVLFALVQRSWKQLALVLTALFFGSLLAAAYFYPALFSCFTNSCGLLEF